MRPNIEIEAEALYYRLFHSYLLQKPSLVDDYEMLRRHYHDHPNSLKTLSHVELGRLKHIQEDVQSGRYTLFHADMDLSDDLPEALKKERSDKDHRALVRDIIRDLDELSKFTGVPELVNTEHPVNYGFLDLMVISNRIAWVVEVKTKSADHSIVGQMMKYFVGLSLKIVNRNFDEVKMITLCPGYDGAAFKGLKQIGARPLLLKTDPLKICDTPC